MYYVKIINLNLTMSEINPYFSSSVDDILMLRRMCYSIRLLRTTFHKKTGKCVS